MDFELISQECSLADPLSKLLKPFHSGGQDTHQSLKSKNPINDFSSETARRILK